MGSEATVTSKGQITIPASVRKQMGLRTGDRVEFRVDDGRAVLRPVRTVDALEEYAGCLAGEHPPSIAEIVRAERRNRGRESNP